MLELLRELFPWVVALYALDGLVQLGRGHLLLVSSPGAGARARRAGLHLVGLSPLAEAVVAHDLPFLASADRVFLFDPARRSEPALVSGVDLRDVPRALLAPVVREARSVRAAGEIALSAPTAGWAARLREDLAALAEPGAAGPRRPDLGAARALRARQRPWAVALRAGAALLAAVTFVAWPAAAYRPDVVTVPPALLLAGAAALVLANAALAFAMLCACGEPKASAAAAALHLAAYPVAALHPLVHASRSLFRRFDAMTVAAALLPAREFHALAARELWRARLSRGETAAELAPAWDARERELVRLLEATGCSAAEALAPPPRDAGAAAWCPLCAGQYRPGFASCSDCGVAAEPFRG